MREGIDEAATWRSAREGDPSSFTSIYDLHRDRVFGHALRLLRSAHDAEDVTAIVFLEAWRRRPSVRVVDGSIIGWLLVTANYAARNYSRTRRRYHAVLQKIPPAPPEDDHSPDIDARIDGEVRDRKVRSALAQLSKNDQDVITLCVIEEMTVPQAAETLGVPQGTVKSRLARAKQRLSVLATASGVDRPIVSGGAE